MTINGQIRDEKLRYDINRKAAEILAKSSGNVFKGFFYSFTVRFTFIFSKCLFSCL